MEDLNTPGGILNYTTYQPDKVVSVLACLELQQICNPTSISKNHSCTSFQSMYSNWDDDRLTEVLTNTRQLYTAQLILDNVFGIDYIISAIPLLASSLASDRIYMPIASN
jgi:hypothetical protein